jgi:hypothetical protein
LGSIAALVMASAAPSSGVVISTATLRPSDKMMSKS